MLARPGCPYVRGRKPRGGSSAPPNFAVASRGVVLTSGAVHYRDPGYMHSVLRAVPPHTLILLSGTRPLRGAAFSVAGLAVEASRASRDGRDRLEWGTHSPDCDSGRRW